MLRPQHGGQSIREQKQHSTKSQASLQLAVRTKTLANALPLQIEFKGDRSRERNWIEGEPIGSRVERFLHDRNAARLQELCFHPHP